MQYSFSQTFGKGCMLLPSSPTPSSQSGSRGKSKETANAHSPVIQSYTLRDRKTEPWIYTNKMETKPHSNLLRMQQETHRQAQQKIKAEIKNVDGLNQRMLNLINELRRDNSAGSNRILTRQHSTESYKNTGIISQRSSASGFRRPLEVIQNESKLRQENQNNGKHKQMENIMTKTKGGMQDQTETRMQYKNKLEERLNHRNEAANKNLQLCYANAGTNKGKHNHENIERQERQESTKQQALRNNLVDIWRMKGGSIGELKIRDRETTHNHKSLAIEGEDRTKQKIGWLKNKVKTIESEMETICNQNIELDHNKQIQEFSYVEDTLPLQEEQDSRSSHKLNSFRENQENCQHCGLSKPGRTLRVQATRRESSQYNSIGFEDKLKKITQKIECYQKKVTSLNLSIGKQDEKKSKADHNPVKMPFTKQENSAIYEPEQSNNKGEISLQTENIGRVAERRCTPTWGAYKAGNQGIEEISYKEEATQKSKGFAPTDFQGWRQSDGSLKERMSKKLTSRACGLKFSKQIELDEEFRKCKKQLSKLPEEVPGFPDSKWSLLEKLLKAEHANRSISLPQRFNVREIFDLKDEEADPFFSIAVEDLKDYKDVINQAISSYFQAEQYFATNILQSLPLTEIRQIFSTENSTRQGDKIRMEEFALILSGETKTNHKCRDVFLLFRRLLSKEGKKKDETLSRSALIKYLSAKENGRQASWQNSQQVYEIERIQRKSFSKFKKDDSFA